MTGREQIRINVIGQGWSGKSNLVKHLSDKYGFDVFRPSDVIREYAEAKGISISSREDYVRAYSDMTNIDPDAVSGPVINSQSERLIVDGMRVPRDVVKTQMKVGMLIVALDCPVELRFAHMLDSPKGRRLRDGGHITTIDQFIADEAIDNSSTDPDMPNVITIMKMAELTLDASQPETTVHQQADEYVGRILAFTGF